MIPGTVLQFLSWLLGPKFAATRQPLLFGDLFFFLLLVLVVSGPIIGLSCNPLSFLKIPNSFYRASQIQSEKWDRFDSYDRV